MPAKVGIDEVIALVLPEQETEKAAEPQARGKRVTMIGDGINDAPALARADVGTGTDSATWVYNLYFN